MHRTPVNEYFLNGATWVATRGTCIRRKVGCILVNIRGHILSTGYNGVSAGVKHCIEPGYECKGANSPSGMNLDECEAIHAEQNALLQCRDVFAIHTCYVTHSPCITCVKLLLGTSCQRIVFRHKYAHDDPSKSLWCKIRLKEGQLTSTVWVHLP